MDLRPGETIIFEGHPCWRFLMRFYLLGIAEAVVVFLIIKWVVSLPTALLVTVIFLAGVFVIGFLRRFFTLYKITNRRIWISRGIIAKHTQEARMDRVQNVSTDQGVIERIMRFGDVDFDTAGHDGESDFIFYGVGNPNEVVQAVDRAQHAAEEDAAMRTAGAFARTRDGMNGDLKLAGEDIDLDAIDDDGLD